MNRLNPTSHPYVIHIVRKQTRFDMSDNGIVVVHRRALPYPVGALAWSPSYDIIALAKVSDGSTVSDGAAHSAGGGEMSFHRLTWDRVADAEMSVPVDVLAWAPDGT
jgi:hypothetical protein